MTKPKYTPVQIEYLKQAEALQQEMIRAGFMATRIEKDPDDITTFHVIYFDGTRDYRIHRAYNGYITVSHKEYKNYPHVSNDTRHKVYTAHQEAAGTGMKVLTANKMQKHIDAENAYHREMQALDDSAANKNEAFINEINALEQQGYTVRWSYDHNSLDSAQRVITGGTVSRNGIELEFTTHKDGYIGKKLRITYKADNDIETFIALAYNHYKETIE